VTALPHRATRLILPGYAAALTLAVTAPLLRPGYLLIRDAVSTPRSYLSDTALGLSESAPRAVPQDFAVALGSAVFDGGVLVKALLIAGLFLAGWGAGRLARLLLPEAGTAGQLVAATVAVWNPFVAERLLQGHWSLLLAYGCLPWVAAAVLDLRTAGRGWAAAVFWIALAGLTPTGLMLAAVVALACVAAPGDGAPRWRCAAGLLGASVLAAAPWLTASLLGGALNVRQADGLAPFAPRAEPLLGTFGSLAGLGGIWNAEAVPPSRATGYALFGTVVLLVVVACGVPALLRRRGHRQSSAEPLLILAAFGVLVPAALATGPGMALLRTMVDAVPGLAVLRDGQKWVALAMPGYALAGAGAVLLLRHRMRAGVAALLCCAALLMALPDLVWGVGGRMRPVHYPPGWAQVARMINAEPGVVAVLPAGTMRQFAWSGGAPVLDPLPRWLRADVLTTGDLQVAGQIVAGEGSRAREVERQLLAGTDPRTLGVGWLVVERGTPGTMGSAEDALAALRPAYTDDDLALYRLGGPEHSAAHNDRSLVLIAHLLWAAMLIGGGVMLAVQALQSSARPWRRS
jgi:hypothetical protein